MAGFFRQTAQRARASGSQLHSSAALPYSAAREAQGEGPWLDDALSASANTTRVAGAVVPGTSIAPPAPLRARADRETQPLPRKSRRSTSAPKNKVSKPAPRSNARVSRTPRSIVEHVVSLAPPPSPRQAATTSVPQLDPIAAGQVPTSTPLTPSATPRKNKPVRPQSRVQQHAARKKTASPRQQAQATPPEVHIHIGRVELTGNTATASGSKRESAGDRRPLSLDDYLQQRRTRRTGAP